METKSCLALAPFRSGIRQIRDFQIAFVRMPRASGALPVDPQLMEEPVSFASLRDAGHPKLFVLHGNFLPVADPAAGAHDWLFPVVGGHA
jgi:hypothetical protein